MTPFGDSFTLWVQKCVLCFGFWTKADTANYDDWNELFCDPLRLADQLRFEDGTRLFDLPHQHRFAALHRVNWRKALAANMVKTHREVRIWIPLAKAYLKPKALLVNGWQGAICWML